MNVNKKAKGQFFTIANPFDNDLFLEWFNNIPNIKNKLLLEPFAGSGNIVRMLQDIGFKNQWVCFDIEPLTIKGLLIKEQDTLKNYPKGFSVAITNPPYLAKNSATRNNLPFPTTKYDDLYKVCLEVMLNNTKYVAAIIPESFITQGLFHNRLYGVVSLTCKMFEDTDCPVCLALFNDNKTKDFAIYSDKKEIGHYQQIKQSLIKPKNSLSLSFNNPKGKIGLFGIDNTKESSIKFVSGDCIKPNIVKPTSRAITRIGIDTNNTNIDYESLIDTANKILNDYRESTYDLFLTAFKGLRKDNRYRRRLDYKNAKKILNIAYEETYG
jgi:hypothetical protein